MPQSDSFHAQPAPPRWPIPPNMACHPRTHMMFAHDLQHDLRDFMADRRVETIAEWAGAVCAAYEEAAGIMAVQDDAILLCLDADPVIDARTLWVAHDQMAAHWRAVHLNGAFTGKQCFVGDDHRHWLNVSYGGFLYTFRQFLHATLALWRSQSPGLIRLFCAAVTGDHNRNGQLAEADLYVALRRLYPIPG